MWGAGVGGPQPFASVTVPWLAEARELLRDSKGAQLPAQSRGRPSSHRSISISDGPGWGDKPCPGPSPACLLLL